VVFVVSFQHDQCRLSSLIGYCAEPYVAVNPPLYFCYCAHLHLSHFPGKNKPDLSCLLKINCSATGLGSITALCFHTMYHKRNSLYALQSHSTYMLCHSGVLWPSV